MSFLKSNSLLCSMCNKRDESVMDLSSNEVMKNTLTEYFKVPPAKLENTLRQLCIQCVYKINSYKDTTVLFQMQLQRKIHGTPKVVQDASSDSNKPLHIGETSTPTSTPIPISFIANKTESNSSLNVIDGSEAPSTPQSAHHALNNEITTIDDQTTSSNISPLRTPYIVEVEDITPEKELQPPPSSTQQQQSLLTITKSKPSTTTSSELLEIRHETIFDERNVATTSHPRQQQKSLQHSSSLISINSRSNSPCSSSQQYHINSSMLEVVRERPESTLATESGGNISRSQLQPLKCQYCSRIYCRKNLFTRHFRRCSARFRYTRTRGASCGTRRHSRASSEVGSASAANDETTQQCGDYTVGNRRAMRKRHYFCPECRAAFDTLQEMRWHRRNSHMQRFTCTSCRNEFTAVHDFDFHTVICKAKHEATTFSTLQNLNENQRSPQSRPMTRAASRAISVVSSAYTTPTPNKKNNHRRKSYHLNRRSNYSEISDENFNTDANANNDDDDDDHTEDNFSVVDSMYSRRMHFTSNWLEDLQNSFDYDDDFRITTYKEYDLYLLEKLKAQIRNKLFKCLVSDCNFKSKTLLEMMVHDYLKHYKSAWFYCQKCVHVFTSKVFLDYHLDCQNDGRFICFRCGDCFEFQHQLDRHLIRHTKYVNYRCNYCNFEFLTEDKLLQHCESEQHHPNSERKLIHIESNMTIVSQQQKQQDQQPSARGEYTVHVKEMHLTRLSERRVNPVGCKLKLKRLIGDIEFKNQRNPNCLGWK